MSEDDRRRWDERYTSPAAAGSGPPAALVAHAHLVPTTGTALDLACGRGDGAVWLASRGLDVLGVDVSPVAVDLARTLATEAGVPDRCRFELHDLDDGLPPGPPADVIVCHRFRDPRLDTAIAERLRPGGVLVAVALSEVGAEPGRFRARHGELLAAFAALEVLVHEERDGRALLVARRP